MKHAFIAPINYLNCVPEDNSFHLILVHLLSNKIYADFYKKKKEKGDFIILDNSAFEFKKPASNQYILDAINESSIIPDVVVLPDYPFQDYKKTVDSAYQSINFFKKFFNYPISFMGVPQSIKGDLDGWIIGYDELCKISEISFIGLSILNIPVAFCELTGTDDLSFNRMFAVSYLQNNNLVYPHIKYHCLGLGSNVRELKYMTNFSFIYSNDSSSAIWHGINGVKYDNSATGLVDGKIQKDVDFFYPLNKDTLKIINSNINYIQKLITNN